MRLLVTVVSPATRQSTDIVLDADAATPMAAVAAELDRFARGGDVGGGGGAGPAAARGVRTRLPVLRFTSTASGSGGG